jgi:hypothetical protein
VLSPQGVRISYRLRGMEQVLRGVEDIKRGYDIGCRGFLLYDEGMLWLVGQMRKDGALPKASATRARSSSSRAWAPTASIRSGICRSR